LAFMTQCVIAALGYSQTEGFYFYELENKGEQYEVTNMTPWNEGYFLLLYGQKNPKVAPQTVNRLLRFGANMSMSWIAGITDPFDAFEKFDVPARGLNRVNENFIVLSATRDTSLNLVSLLVNQIDGFAGMVKKVCVVTDSMNDIYSHYAASCYDSSSQEIYLISQLQKGDNISRVHISKLDTQLNVLWQQNYELGLPGIIMRYVAVISPSGELFLALFNGGLGWGSDYFVRFDSTGNLLGIEPGYYPQVILTPVDLKNHPSGNLVYMCAGLFGDDEPAFRLVMATPDLDTIWTQSYVDYNVSGSLLKGGGSSGNLSIAPDGRILVHAGLRYQHLVCYSPDGELLWRRKISFDSIVPGTNYRIVSEYGAQWAEDGGIILSGVIGDLTKFDALMYRPYLLKLDSMGCLHPDCGLWMTVPISETYPIRMDDFCWQIWPNPATDRIHLRLDATCPPASAIDQAVLYDIYGGEVYRKYLSGDSEVQILDIGPLPRGMYVLRVQSGPVILGVRTLIYGD
jgi:hypothetical protein